MTIRYRATPVVLIAVATIALLIAQRGTASPPAGSMPATIPATRPAVEITVAPGSSTDALRQAMTAAGDAAVTVHLPAGKFDVGGLVVPAGGPLRWIGTRGADGSYASSTVLTGSVTFNQRPVTLTDLIFHTPATAGLKAGASTVPVLVKIEKSGPVSIDRCYFTGSADSAVTLDHCHDWAFGACLFKDIYTTISATSSDHGRIVHCTLIDDRLGHGTNSLTTGRIELHACDHLAMFNNALSPRDPDGKILLLENCGNDFKSDYNLWTGVITHQYGTEQQSTWQNSFRTLDSWQAHTAAMWGPGGACDAHSHSEPIGYCNCPDAIPEPESKAFGECSGAGAAAAIIAGVPLPTTDLLGRTTDHSIGCFNLVPSKVVPPFDPPPGYRGFTVTLPAAGQVSVGIYDGEWLLKTVASGVLLTAGRHDFGWDGCDNTGQPVKFNPASKIQWRAVLTPQGPAALDIAGPGVKLAPGCTGTTLANNPQENGEGIWCDKDGNLYEVAPYDEAGSTILSVDKDGHYRWRNWQHNGTLVTGDDKYIYVIGDTKPIEDGKVAKGTLLLERFPLAGCDPVPWGDGKIALCLGDTAAFKPTGAAVANGKIYFNDGSRARLIVFPLGSDKADPDIEIPAYSIGAPIAQTDGSLTFVGRGDPRREVWQASLFRITADGKVSNITGGTIVPGSFLANGAAETIFVSDSRSVFTWTMVGSQNLFKASISHADADRHADRDAAQPYPILPITYMAGSSKSLWVRRKEPGYARSVLDRYDLQPDQSLRLAFEIQSLEGQNGSFADPRDPFAIYSPDFFRYRVDPATAQWRWDRNYDWTRWAEVGQSVGCSTGAIFYLGGKKFMAATVCNSPTTTSRTVLICAMDDDENAQPCGAIGGKFFGDKFDEKAFDPLKSGRWVWTPPRIGFPLRNQDVTFVESAKTKDGAPYPDCTWGTYVERDGTIVWPGESMHYLRPRGLDKTGTIPVYDWSDAVTIKYQDFKERDDKYTARVDLDGSIYDLSTTKAEPLPPGYWGMGTVLTRLTPAGRRLWTVPVNLTAKGLAVDDNFVYVGSCFGPFINQYTKDGLLVRQFSMGKTDSQFGWFDFPTPINSVTDPKTGDSIITAEEQWMGRIMVLKVPGAVTRLSGEVQ